MTFVPVFAETIEGLTKKPVDLFSIDGFEVNNSMIACVIAAAIIIVVVQVAMRAPKLVPSGAQNFVELALGGEVRFDLRLGEDGFKDADEIGRANDVFAEGAEEFDGAGIDHRDVHDGVARRVLHGDLRRAFRHGSEFGFELLP